MNLLATDTETTGLIPKVPFQQYVEHSQIIQLGVVVTDYDTGDAVDEFETKIRFEGTHDNIEYGRYPGLTWSNDAVNIHGMSISSLIHEPSFEQAAKSFHEFVREYFPDHKGKTRVPILAHNPYFDAYHVNQLLFLGGGNDSILIDHRSIDTHTIGKVFYGVDYSDQLMERVGMKRDKHHALVDATMCQRVYKMLREDINSAYKRLATNRV